MNIWLKRAGLALGILAGLAMCGAFAIYFISEQMLDRRFAVPRTPFKAVRTAETVARGKHLATIAGCTHCHGRDLQGALFDALPSDSAVYARNLRRVMQTWSDADFEHLLRHGVKPDGRGAIVMPSDGYVYLDDSDVGALIAYLRSLPVEKADTPPARFGLFSRLGLILGLFKADFEYMGLGKPPLDLGPRYAKGRHLALTACAECHGTALTGHSDDPNFITPDLMIVAAYSREDFTTLLRTGKAAGNREIGLMSDAARWRFAEFTDDEVGALYDYLSARGAKLAE